MRPDDDVCGKISVNSLTLCAALASLRQRRQTEPTIGVEVGQGTFRSSADQGSVRSERAAHERTPSTASETASARARVPLGDALLPLARRETTGRGPLAQLAEQLTLNQQVRGSSPWRLTNDRFASEAALRSEQILHGPQRSSSRGEVSELADEHDLGSCAARRRSSSLLFPTIGRESVVRRPVHHAAISASLKECSHG